MARTSDWVEMEVLVTVKAYPQPSQSYREAVCVAGIRLDTPNAEWIRLYPVTFRELDPEYQFKKWDVIRLRAAKHNTDCRRETWRPDVDSIMRLRSIPAGGYWPERRAIVEPLIGPTMCELREGRKGGGDASSLGLVRVEELIDVLVEDAEGWSAQQVAILSQPSLIGKTPRLLEKPAHTFFYKWRCPAPGCRGHRQSIVDWEVGQAYRRWQRSGYNPVDAILGKWRDEVCAGSREVSLFVGDQHQRPGGFMVLGAFWPSYAPNRDQLTLAVG